MLFALVTLIIVAAVSAAISRVRFFAIGIRTVGGAFPALFFLAALAVLILMFFASIIS